MSFRRTPSGLSNLHLFSKVDVIVFVEGGISFSIDEVNANKFSRHSSDIRFWQSLFGAYKYKNKTQFRAVGSKSTLELIARDVDSGRVRNVIVAMDSDHDEVNSRKISNPHVIYTKGYSWENEVWNGNTIIQAYSCISGACQSGIFDEEEVIAKAFGGMLIKLKGLVRADIVLSQYENSCISRGNSMRYIEINGTAYPKINMVQVKKSLLEAKIKRNDRVVRKSNFTYSVQSNCYGHLLGEYGYRLLRHIVSTFTNLPKLAKEHAASIVVEKFISGLMAGYYPDLKSHYDASFIPLNA